MRFLVLEVSGITDNDYTSCSLFNLFGELVYSAKVLNGVNEIDNKAALIPNGIYLVVGTINGSQIFNQKVVILK
ncbi:MAG: hypothetical protein H0W62_04700 [Chitinophagales bacterium]|nr:hypothetical protein [Chitinophagales bacterium]